MSQSTEGHTLIIKIQLDNSGDAIRYKIDQVTVAEGKIPTAQIHFDCIHCRAKYFISPKIVQLMELEMIPDEKQAIEVKKEPEFYWLASGISMEDLSDSGDKEQDIGHEMLVAYNDHIKEERELDLFELGSSDKLPSDDEADTLQGVGPEIPMAPVYNEEIQPPEIVENENPIRIQPLDLQPFVRLIRIDAEMKDQGQQNFQPQKEKPKKTRFYTCDICKTSIKYQRSLIRHMKSHMGIRFLCSECLKSFSLKTDIAKHKKRFHQSQFRICEVCGWSQTCNKDEYLSHLRRRHPEFHIKGIHPKVQNFNGVDFPCIYCEPQATFESFEELGEHLGDTHDRNFACTRCPKAFNEKNNLNRHIESVHEKKMFKCPKCDKVFTWQSNLNTHLRSHNIKVV